MKYFKIFAIACLMVMSGAANANHYWSKYPEYIVHGTASERERMEKECNAEDKKQNNTVFGIIVAIGVGSVLLSTGGLAGIPFALAANSPVGIIAASAVFGFATIGGLNTVNSCEK